jgi:D-inositol-3-phosphate glycosyltransferase
MPRRIAFISEHASPLAKMGGADAGGQNIYVDHTARELAACGHFVDVFTRRDDRALPEIVTVQDRLRVIHVPAGAPCFVRKEELLPCIGPFADFVTHFAQQMQRRPLFRGGFAAGTSSESIEGAKYDIVHAHFFMSAEIARRVKKRLGIPFVVTFHALGKVRLQYQPHDEFPPERIALERRAVASADAIIAECPQDRDDLLTLYGATPEKLRMIPCGFDPLELYPVARAEARRHLGIADDVPVALQLGRMVPRKGIDTAVRAVGRLRRENAGNALLFIVGGGSAGGKPAPCAELARLQGIAVEEGIPDAVRFTGPQPREELKYYYSAANAFITTPWYEPFGITPVEAMACGAPVIGARVGGIKFTVVDGETGFLVPERDPAAVAGALARLCADADLQAQMARGALRRAHSLFTWSRITASIASLYEQVLQPRAAHLPRRAIHEFPALQRTVGVSPDETAIKL